MDIITQRWLVIFVLALTCHSSDSADPVPAVMCATGTFTASTRAFITCFFNRDISVGHKYNFNVVQYTSSGASSGNHVVLCNWRADNDKECKVSEGYSYDGDVSKKLTVEIPEVSRSHAGLYACQILPADDIPVETCVLNVTDPPITTTPDPPLCGCQPCRTSESSAAAVGIILGILCLLLIVLLILLLVYQRKRYPLFFTNLKKDMARLKCGHATNAPPEASHSIPELGTAEDLRDENHGPVPSLAPEEVRSLLPPRNKPGASVSMFGTVVNENVTDRGEQASVEMRNQRTQTELTREQLRIDDWTAEHVKEWLMEQSVSKYQPLIDKHVTGETLLTLDTEKALEGLGLSNKIGKKHVPTLLTKIKDLKQFHEKNLKAMKEGHQ